MITLVYGVLAYVVFLASFLYAIGFLTGLLVPKGINDGAAGPVLPALLVNAALLSAFAVQHSVMARPGFKAWWTRFVPRPVERSTFVLLASLVLFLLYWQWRPMPSVVWDVPSGAARAALWALAGAGWATVLASTFMLNHFDLFGLRQVWLHFAGRPYTALGFRTPMLYRWIRHPIMLGFVVAFWAAPTMTAGHLVFALATTGYILVGIRFEERDLEAAHGAVYRSYRERTSMLVPAAPRSRQPDASPT